MEREKTKIDSKIDHETEEKRKERVKIKKTKVKRKEGINET